MNELESLRNEIDRIDKELADLFCRRMEIVEKIASCKKETGLPIADPAREAALLASRLSCAPDDALRPYFKSFFETLLALSKDYQAELGGKR